MALRSNRQHVMPETGIDPMRMRGRARRDQLRAMFSTRNGVQVIQASAAGSGTYYGRAAPPQALALPRKAFTPDQVLTKRQVLTNALSREQTTISGPPQYQPR